MLSAMHAPGLPLRTKVGNFEFDLDMGATVSAHWRSQGTGPVVEPFETEIFLKLLSDNPKFLDIGSNIGWYTCLASAASGKKADIFAFEPEPSNFTLLSRNVALNGFHRARPIQTAIGSSDGQIDLFLNSDNAGDHRIGVAEGLEGREALPVAVSKLDTIMAANSFVPDLIKIDVQGAEPHVFGGGKETFIKAGGGAAMLVEFFPTGMGAEAAHKLANSLFSFWRQVFALYPYEGGQLQPISLETLHEAIDGCINPTTDKYIDLLIAPTDGRMERLRNRVGRKWEQWT